MTDTAFLGRVGEIELGACYRRGILSRHLYDGIRFQHRRTDLNRPPQRRRKLQGNRTDFLSGHLFPACHGSDFIHILHRIFTIYLKNIISSPHIYDAAESYIHWRVYGFFFFVMVMFRAFFVGTTQTKTLTLNSIVMVLSNVVFNYILISVNSVSRNWELPALPSVRHWPKWYR